LLDAQKSALVSAKCAQIGAAGECADVSEVIKRMNGVDALSEQIQDLDNAGQGIFKQAISNGREITTSSVETLVATQSHALDLLQKQMSTHVNGLVQAQKLKVATQCYAFTSQNQAVASAFQRNAATGRIMTQEHAAGVVAEAEGRAAAALSGLSVKRQEVVDSHQESMLGCELEREKDETDNHKQQMKQILQNKIAADKQQLEAEAQQQRLELDAAKLDLDMKKEADDYSRVVKELETAMNRYTAELDDATSRCWRSGRGYKITSVAPKIAKRDDGTRYVTDWSVGYVPR